MLSVFFVALWAAGSLAALPQGWQACHVGSDDCFMNAVNVALRSLKNGNKQLGVGPIDPLKIISLRIDQGTGPVSVKLEFQDLDMYGLSTCNVIAIKNDNWELLEGHAICEPFDMKGNYKVSGRVLTLPISGNGKCHLHFDVMKANITIKLNEVSTKGKKYLGVSSFNMVLEPLRAKFNFENLFNGDKALIAVSDRYLMENKMVWSKQDTDEFDRLKRAEYDRIFLASCFKRVIKPSMQCSINFSDNMNTFLNENSEVLVKELTPAFSKGLSQAFYQITTQVFSRIPFNEINIS